MKTFYVDGLVRPHFSFMFSLGTWVMLGNHGVVGDDGDFGTALDLQGLTPEEWLRGFFGDNWR